MISAVRRNADRSRSVPLILIPITFIICIIFDFVVYIFTHNKFEVPVTESEKEKVSPIKQLPKPPNVGTILPFSLRSLDEEEGEIVPINCVISSYFPENKLLTVKGAQTNTGLQFHTYGLFRCQPIEYVEVKILKKHRGFPVLPFSLALYQSSIDANQTKQQLPPISFSLFAYESNVRPSKLEQCISIEKEPQEGDTLGIGMTLIGHSNYVYFATHNGNWVGSWSFYNSSPKSFKFGELYYVFLVTGDYTRSPQLDVELIVDPKNFLFDIDLKLVDCPMCNQKIVERALLVNSTNCAKQFCSFCMKQKLNNHDKDKLEFTCVCGCGDALSDDIMRLGLSNTDYKLIKRMLYISSVRADPNLKFCKKKSCLGVIKRGETGAEVKCTVCSEPFCYDCYVGHSGLSCKDYQRKLQKMEKSKLKKEEKLIKKGKAFRCTNCKTLTTVGRNQDKVFHCTKCNTTQVQPPSRLKLFWRFQKSEDPE